MAIVIGAFVFLTAPASAADAGSDCHAPPATPLLRFAQAVALFDACSPALVQARAQVEGARADRITLGHAPNPTLGFSVSNINPQAGIGNGALRDRTVDTSLRIDQVLERGGKRSARRAQADASQEAATHLLDDALQRGHEAVLESYVGLSAAQATATLLHADADSSRAALQAMRARLDAGDVPLADVNRAALDAARADADAEAADLAALQAAAALSTTLGIPPLDVQTRLEPVTALAERLDAQDAAGDFHDRPDLRAAAARLAAARSALALADAGRKRDVDVLIGYDHWPVSPTNTQGTGNSYTLGFSVPLFVHDSGRGPQLHARADVQAASGDLDSREASAERELATAGRQAAQTRALAQRYRSALLPAAEQILAAEELAYQRGAAGLLELLDARRNQRQVAVAAIAAERDAVSAAGRLRLAQGHDPAAQVAPQSTPTPERTP